MKQIFIVGPTASGKSAAAIALAQKINGEIISADSRAVYRGMDIGTAKPNSEESAGITHYGFDVVEPNEPFSVAEFKRLHNQYLKTIYSKGKYAITVGATGLYLNAVLYNYVFRKTTSTTNYAGYNIEELQHVLQQKLPEVAKTIDTHNKRRVIRALQTGLAGGYSNHSLAEGAVVFGLFPGWPKLEERINERNKHMLANGLIEETMTLVGLFGNIEALNTEPYKQVLRYLDGEIAEDSLLPLINLRDRQLAKRQMTWFKRDSNTQWFSSPEDLLARAIKV